MNYLSPLIMAYDDTLRDKNEVIRAYEVCFIVLLILVVFALVDAITLKENCKARTIFPVLQRNHGHLALLRLRSVNLIEKRA